MFCSLLSRFLWQAHNAINISILHSALSHRYCRGSDLCSSFVPSTQWLLGSKGVNKNSSLFFPLFPPRRWEVWRTSWCHRCGLHHFARLPFGVPAAPELRVGDHSPGTHPAHRAELQPPFWAGEARLQVRDHRLRTIAAQQRWLGVKGVTLVYSLNGSWRTRVFKPSPLTGWSYDRGWELARDQIMEKNETRTASDSISEDTTVNPLRYNSFKWRPIDVWPSLFRIQVRPYTLIQTMTT